MNAYPITSLAIILIVLLQFSFAFLVGKARGRSGIKAPAMTGDPGLERAVRVQANTIEQVLMFLPALVLALPLLGDIYAAILAAIWIVGRVVFAKGYLRDPKARATGFIITVLALLVAVICAIWAAVRALILIG